MLTDKEFSYLIRELNKKRFTVHQEIALYNAFEYLSQKYKNKFFEWYLNYEKEYQKCLPEIINPKNEIEMDVKRINENIKNQTNYDNEEVVKYEKIICEYLASDISRINMYKNYSEIGVSAELTKLNSFLNRYEKYRTFYIIGFQIKYAPDLDDENF
jgi:hypothetical protein